MPVTPPHLATAPDHYENFPVASWLCPRELRAPIAAIYHFARTADDIADEGDADAPARLDDLARYRAELAAVARGQAPSPRWPRVFGPLAHAIAAHRLPLKPLDDLLDAFMQDVRKTRDAEGYATRDELLGYCRRSADPVGRLLLHLHGVDDAEALARSDAVCTGLQLANFWQDLSVDLPRGRWYLPDADLQAHGLGRGELLQLAREGRAAPAAARALVAELVDWTRTRFRFGAPIVHDVPGRAGWELRLVVQGGLQILRHVEGQQYDTFSRRPRLGRADWLPMLLRTLRMPRQSAP